MKAIRTRKRTAGHEQRMPPRNADSYRAGAKAAAAACPRCKASLHAGHWSWRPAAENAASVTCPACLRIEQNQPAGWLTLRGEWFRAHRSEIMAAVAKAAEREWEEHPLQRIISAEESGGEVRVTTTDAHLARGLGIAVQAAFKGEIEFDAGGGESFVRATWTR